MNCHDVAAALEERAFDSLAADTRDRIDAHAEFCVECRGLLAAERALRRDPIPPTPAFDVARLVMAHGATLSQSRARPAHGAHRAPGAHDLHLHDARDVREKRERVTRRVIPLRTALFGVLAVGGVVFAALELLAPGRDDGRADVSSEIGAPLGGGYVIDTQPAPALAPASVKTPPRSLIEYVDEAESAAADALRADLMSAPVRPDGDMFALLKVTPLYPPAAAEQGLEGHAVVEFTVTPEGDVADPFIVESSDPVFEAPTLDAIRKAKYKPRVVDGRAVAADGIRNRFSYRVEAGASGLASGEGASSGTMAPAGDLDWLGFRALLAPALQCVERSDLVCVELALDEIRASYVLTVRQSSELSRIYGFVYHRLGNLERALAAYEEAARPFEGEPPEGAGDYFATPWMTAAMIHYERHRYQEALDAAIRYLRAAENPRPADFVFVDRLRQLGAVVR